MVVALILAQTPAGHREYVDGLHGFASVAVADGNSLYLVGKVLGHSQAATTQRYAHLQLDPVRAVADRTSHKLADALTGARAGGQVIKMASNRRT